MLRRLLDRGRSPARGSRPEIESALSHLVWEPPQAAWAALLTNDGRFLACFPSRPAMEEDRIAAMSAAIASLGERICRELGTGELRYGLLAGAAGSTLLVSLDRDHLLTLGLAPEASIDASIEAVRGSALSLRQVLGLPALPG